MLLGLVVKVCFLCRYIGNLTYIKPSTIYPGTFRNQISNYLDVHMHAYVTI